MLLFRAEEAQGAGHVAGQLLVRVALLQVEVDAPFLQDGNLECLHELYQGAVRVLHVGEMAVGLAHLEVPSAVADEAVA